MKKIIFYFIIISIFSHCSGFKSIDTDTTLENIPNRPNVELRMDLVDYARTLIGSKYIYGGTTPRGFDCSGFTQYVYRYKHIDLPHNSGAQAQKGKKIKISKLQPGDLVFFKKGRKVNHVGMVTKIVGDDIYMIHSSSSRGIIEECLTSSTYWKPKLLYYRNYIDE